MSPRALSGIKSSLYHQCEFLRNYLFVIAIVNLITLVSPHPAVLIEKTDCNSPLCVVANQTIVDKTNDDLTGYCKTKACYHASKHTLESMDLTVHPCDDFYHFACGKFMSEKGESDDIFTRVQNELNEQLLVLIGEKIDPNDPASFNMAKRLFNVCMNESLIEEHGLEPLVSITDKLGGWPVVKGDQWSDVMKWTDIIKEFNKIGYSADYIFGFTVASDLRNTSSRIIYIGQDELGLDHEYLINGLDDEIVKAYYEYMVDIAVIFGAERNRAEQEMKESLEFEIQLANISMPREELRNYSNLYNPFSLRELQTMYPYIQWIEYINALLPTGMSVDENEVVVVLTPSYFEKLGELLKETPSRVIANYLMWCVAEFSAPFLNNEVSKRQWDYITDVYGDHGEMIRWKDCISISSNWMSIAVGAMYVRKHFEQNSKAEVLEMVNRIRTEFEIILENVDWMDDETRRSAIDKLHVMSNHIGYPDELMDNDKIEKYYELLKPDEKNHLSFALSINVFYTDQALRQLREPVNKNDWENLLPPFIVNAFYSYDENVIQFPAAILQDQFFSAERPRYMNFGAIGSIIGHEITHGFDDEGSQFDLNGNLVDWWQPETKANYLKRVKCIISQYENYTEPLTGLKLDGVNTQSENIADNGGIKEAYLAYQKWVQQNEAELKLPGLDYTPQQMFWIAAAQTYCSVSRAEALKDQITTDTHPPNQFRVLGPLSNRKEFANDFQCSEGSPMNPTKICEVW